jgi:FMNH2-dependent dimethyl sulfone monooxygenase
MCEPSPAALRQFRLRVAAGAGGFLLVGTSSTIAERLLMLSAAGIDGVLLTWVDYITGLQQFRDGVLPLLERRGLRRPF